MSTHAEVAKFLSVFKAKMKIWNVVFMDNRDKNVRTLMVLEYNGPERTKFLEELKVEDYSQGPLPEEWLGGKEMWVFGKKIKGHEIYIKITLGPPSANVICISFHIAEHPIKYPLRQRR
jgi:hypothetical protein